MNETSNQKGVFILPHTRHLLFSEKVELNLSDLKRRPPKVTFNPSDFDDDEILYTAACARVTAEEAKRYRESFAGKG